MENRNIRKIGRNSEEGKKKEKEKEKDKSQQTLHFQSTRISVFCPDEERIQLSRIE